MSFFDDDEPTRVGKAPRRPATPRQPAPGPETAGGSHVPDPQTARTRQLVALGVGVLLLILIVLGVKGCLDSRQERALKDYSRDASAIVTDSNDQVSKPFFQLLSSGKSSGNDLQLQVNQVRQAADDDAKRAKELSVPDDMRSAQQNLLTVMNLRSQALTRIAEKLTAAQGRGPQAEAATNEIAGQMQMFLASDVLYSQRAAPLIVQALDEAGISGQTIPESQSLPGYTWLAPDTVAQAIGGTAGGGTTSGGSSCPAGTSCGHGIVSTSIGTVVLSDSGSTTVPAKAPVAVSVKVANQGDNVQKNVIVTAKLTAPGQTAISAKKTVNATQPGTETDVAVPLPKAPAAGTAATLTVKVDPVAGEKTTDNNTATYTVLFSG
jgi:hypothetical protein